MRWIVSHRVCFKCRSKIARSDIIGLFGTKTARVIRRSKMINKNLSKEYFYGQTTQAIV